MGRTRTNVRHKVAEQFGLRHFISATSTAGSSTTATDVDALGQFVNDGLIGFHYYNVAATHKDHVITNNVQSTGVVTFIPGDSGVTGAQAYEILPFSTTEIHRAIDTALLMLYTDSLLVRKLWTHAVAGSPIYNADMSYWTSSSTLHGWTVASSTLARTQVAASKLIGENSSALSGSAGTLTLDPVWARYLVDLAPGDIRLHAWMQVGSAGNNRVNFLENGSAVANSGAHSADGDWHVVSTSKTSLTDGETDLDVQIEYAAGTLNTSLIWLEGGAYPDLHPIPVPLYPDGPTEIYSTPLSWSETNARTYVMPHNLRPETGFTYMKFHDEAVDVETGVLRWIRKPPAGSLLWIVGNAPLSLPTTDAGVIEISQTEELLVAKTAALILMESNSRSGDRAWADRAARLSRDVDRLSRGNIDNDNSASLGPNW